MTQTDGLKVSDDHQKLRLTNLDVEAHTSVIPDPSWRVTEVHLSADSKGCVVVEAVVTHGAPLVE